MYTKVWNSCVTEHANLQLYFPKCLYQFKLPAAADESSYLFHILPNTWWLVKDVLTCAFLIVPQWYFVMVLIAIFLIANDVGHLDFPFYKVLAKVFSYIFFYCVVCLFLWMCSFFIYWGYVLQTPTPALTCLSLLFFCLTYCIFWRVY